jgi:hypothetical protein
VISWFQNLLLSNLSCTAYIMVFGVLFLSMPLAILGNNFVLVWWGCTTS